MSEISIPADEFEASVNERRAEMGLDPVDTDRDGSVSTGTDLGDPESSATFPENFEGALPGPGADPTEVFRRAAGGTGTGTATGSGILSRFDPVGAAVSATPGVSREDLPAEISSSSGDGVGILGAVLVFAAVLAVGWS